MLPLKSLRTTNPNLDQRKVARLTTQLQTGEVTPEDLQPIQVRRIGRRFFITDGNHRVEALRKSSIDIDVFSDVCRIEP